MTTPIENFKQVATAQLKDELKFYRAMAHAMLWFAIAGWFIVFVLIGSVIKF
jgi:hypothetical protein